MNVTYTCLPGGKDPVFATEGAACFDLHTRDGATIHPGAAAALRTGLKFELEPGSMMLLFSRSGHGFKFGVRLANCVGVIDADFRGEVVVKIHNDGERAIKIEAGERIAQATVLPKPKLNLVKRVVLSTTVRGEGGFGSTGR